jgi:hypothetical protein
MWLSTKLSALWLAACAIAGPPDTAVTNADGIRSIPVRCVLWTVKGNVLIENIVANAHFEFSMSSAHDHLRRR